LWPGCANADINLLAEYRSLNSIAKPPPAEIETQPRPAGCGREGEVADGRFGASSSQNLDFSDWPV